MASGEPGIKALSFGIVGRQSQSFRNTVWHEWQHHDEMKKRRPGFPSRRLQNPFFNLTPDCLLSPPLSTGALPDKWGNRLVEMPPADIAAPARRAIAPFP